MARNPDGTRARCPCYDGGLANCYAPGPNGWHCTRGEGHEGNEHRMCGQDCTHNRAWTLDEERPEGGWTWPPEVTPCDTP